MNALSAIKNTCEDFTVEFEVLSPIKTERDRNEQLSKDLTTLETELAINQALINQYNTKIDNLTNHADGLDYMVAVGSGILAGIIDILFVEEFSFENASKSGNEHTDNFVIKIAQKQGYKGNDLAGAVKFLENKFPLAADKATNEFGGGLQHHLRDFSHHPTPIGLIFSFLTQFTRKVYGTGVDGRFRVVSLKENDLCLIGKNLPEKFTFGVVNWFFHIVSDLAGSSTSILEGKYGTGLPGPLVSLLKEISVLPIFKNTNENGYKEFSVWISKLFNGTLLGKTDENGKQIPIKFDLRTEIGVAQQLGKQAIPVLVNECIVRGFYFIRHLFLEIQNVHVKKISDLKKINWYNTLPYKNRTIIRMLTISTGTLTAIDLADAAIESAVKSGGVNPAFIPQMLVNVNFVGIGRFAIAVSSDAKMGWKRNRLCNERIIAMNKQLSLLNGKTYYKQADMWKSGANAAEVIDDAYSRMEKTDKLYAEAYLDITDNLNQISDLTDKVEQKNPELTDEMLDILEWG